MNQETKKIVKKVLSIVVNSFFYVFIAFMLVFAIANIKVKTNMDIPNVFGTGFLTVQSDSMEGNRKDSFFTGDLVFVRAVNDKNRDKLVKTLKVGDIITFFDTRIDHFNTHRIVDIRSAIDGKLEFVTQGDKRNTTNPYDPNGANDPAHYEVVHQVNVLGNL
jgi:signal peptidase